MKNEQEMISNFVESCHFENLDPKETLNALELVLAFCGTNCITSQLIGNFASSWDDPSVALNLLKAQDWSPSDEDIVNYASLRVIVT